MGRIEFVLKGIAYFNAFSLICWARKFAVFLISLKAFVRRVHGLFDTKVRLLYIVLYSVSKQRGVTK